MRNYCVLFFALLSGLLHAAEKPALANKPNVVIIYGDDVGYADVGAYGSKLIPTPNIDRLAAEGLRFTDGHCTAATCTPSRFSMLTGIHGFRHGVGILPPNAPLKISTEILTLPKVFQQAGYQTAVVGKWHLGLGKGNTDWNGEVRPGPREVGFDYHFLLPSTNDRVPCVYLEQGRVVNLDPADPLYVGKKPEGFTGTVYPDGRKNPEAMTYYRSSHGHNHSVINGVGRIGTMYGGKAALWNDETMADEFVNRTAKYLESRDKTKPFFLFFSSQDIHVPRTPHPRFKGKSKLTYRGDAMVQLDWSTGAIMDLLEKHGLTEHTLIIWSSDNGPVYDDGYRDGTTVRTSSKEVDRGHDASGPFTGGKYRIQEGGTRVPFILRWPARIKPGVSTALVSQVDFTASFAALFGVALNPEDSIDSRDNLAALLGEDETGLPYMLEETGGTLALREGPWKLVQNKGKRNKNAKPGKPPAARLYHLGKDIAEKTDVASEQAERVARMQGLLEKIRTSKSGIRGL